MHWFWRASIAVAIAWICFVLTTLLYESLRGLIFSIGVNPIQAYQVAGFLYWVGTFFVAIAAFGLISYWTRTPFAGHTRCRKCGHILRGITEPRCPECGERI